MQPHSSFRTSSLHNPQKEIYMTRAHNTIPTNTTAPKPSTKPTSIPASLIAPLLTVGTPLIPSLPALTPLSNTTPSTPPSTLPNGATNAIWLQLKTVFLPPYTNTSNLPANAPFTHTRVPFNTSVSMRSVAGSAMETGACDDEDVFAQMRPGWPGSKPSVGETERKGYGKLSDVVKVRDVSLGTRESVVSGPERVKGAETVRVSV
jgi:hypothetical protein